MSNTPIKTVRPIRTMVRGAYDLQKLRIQVGNRIVANFKTKVGQLPGMKEEALDDAAKELLAQLREEGLITDSIVGIEARVQLPDPDSASEQQAADAAGVDLEDDESDDDGDPEHPKEDKKAAKKAAKFAEMVMDAVMKQHKELTEGRKKFPAKDVFRGTTLISSYTELCLLQQYADLLTQEKQHFRRMGEVLEDYPIYTTFLSTIPGIGPAMAGVIISEIDIHIARYPSSLWKYSGLDVVTVTVEVDGKMVTRQEGRSKRDEHLVERTYLDKDGKEQTRRGITYNPFLKTKLAGVLAANLLRSKRDGLYASYRQIYLDYKHRLENHALYGSALDGTRVPGTNRIQASKGRRHRMALRYMIKMFLIDLFTSWRKLESLPVPLPYHEAKLGLKHGGHGQEG
jgi:hypothetical protein